MTWLYAHRKLIIVLVMVALGVLTVALYLSGVTVDDIIAYTSGAGALPAALTIIGLFWLKPLVVFVPSTALYLAAGVLFNPWIAILVVYLGSAMEAVVGYYLGRSLGYEQIEGLMERNERAKRYFTYNRNNSAATSFWSRVMPLPFDLVSLVYGASGVPLASFTVFSLVGSAPWIISWAFAGNAILTPLSREFLLPFGICLALTGAVFLLSRRFPGSRDSSDGSDTDAK